jgi:hypothetical protein
MSDTRDAFGPLLAKVQAEMRSMKRDVAMLRAQVAELPTVAQFQAGLDAIDARITETHVETQTAIAGLTAMILALRDGP